MKKIKVCAHAKINLFLEVLGLRNDGYHEVETVLQSIELNDTLFFSVSERIEIIYKPPVAIPPDKDLILKAVGLLKKETGISENISVKVEKRIPLGAGMGGGSADAAATLVALNKLWDLNLPIAYLKELGEKLGADVPFFLHGGTMLAQGKGEKLKSIPSLPFCYIVIVKPALSISTEEAYRLIDRPEGIPKKVLPMIEALATGSLENINSNLYNVFEEAVFRRYPELKELTHKMLEAGAKGSLLTGSGSAVFALADSREPCDRISESLSSNNILVIVTSSYPQSLEV